MSDLEITKFKIVRQLQSLCAHCANHRDHTCPLQEIASRVQEISGIPLIVNNQFRGVLWTK